MNDLLKAKTVIRRSTAENDRIKRHVSFTVFTALARRGRLKIQLVISGKLRLSYTNHQH